MLYTTACAQSTVFFSPDLPLGKPPILLRPSESNRFGVTQSWFPWYWFISRRSI